MISCSLFDTWVNSLLWELKNVLSNVTYVELLYMTTGGKKGVPFLDIYLPETSGDFFFCISNPDGLRPNHVVHV